ncbi:MAG TPA: GNAT family N-acetyltransferase [Kribbella sp.]|jgi:GNAT superfamily N-acetyltransferase
MTVSIRPASAGDAPRVAQIYVQSWNLGFGQLMPPLVLDGDRVSRWAAELITGRTRWWVAEWDGLLAGFVGVGPSRDPVDPELGELDTIAVDPGRWRTGIGTALMRTALEAFVDDGFPEAILWTLAAYDRGQRFYESAGWKRDGGVRDEGHQVSFRHSLRQSSRLGSSSGKSDE